MAQLNAKVMHTLFYALGANEYTMVSLCQNAKKVYDKLQVTHERTNRVKETKVGMFIDEYELFSMQWEESISKNVQLLHHHYNQLEGFWKDLCQ